MRNRPGSIIAVVLVLGLAGVSVLLGPPKAVGQNNNDRRENMKKGMQSWRKAEILRVRKKFEKASETYEEAVEAFNKGGGGRWVRFSRLMADFCERVPDLKGRKLKSGVYTGTERGYSADVKVAVKIRRGRIRGVAVIEQKESRAYKSLKNVPALIRRRQSPSVEATTRATMTSYAVMSAALKALEKAKKDEDDSKKEDKEGDKKAADD